MKKDLTCEVAIIGGGHMGLMLAMMLAEHGIDVVLIEKRKIEDIQPTGDPSRLLAISNGSIDILSKHNIKLKFSEIGQEIKTIAVIEQGLRDGYLEFNPTDIGVDNFGYMVDEHDLNHALIGKARGIKKFYNRKVLTASADARFACLLLDDHQMVKAKLAIVADGKKSIIRNQLGIETSHHDYKQVAVVCDISHEENHNGIAIEKFLPTGPFASLPKKGGFVSSIVWTVEEGIAKTLQLLDNPSLLPLIEERFDNIFGQIKIISTLKYFKLERVVAKKYHTGRFILIGDALHTLHPLAGQGLNLSLRDGDYLCDAICEQKSLGLDISYSNLGRNYEQMRKTDNSLMSGATHGLNTLFSNNLFPLTSLRKIGLNLVESAPGLKKIFMQYASKGHTQNDTF